jgi:hypothetical protein
VPTPPGSAPTGTDSVEQVQGAVNDVIRTLEGILDDLDRSAGGVRAAAEVLHGIGIPGGNTAQAALVDIDGLRERVQQTTAALRTYLDHIAGC